MIEISQKYEIYTINEDTVSKETYEAAKELKEKLEEITFQLCLDKKELEESGFFGRACSRLIKKNKESRELLLSIIKQDKNRGYPTHKEWNNLVQEVKSFLIKYPES